MQCDRCQTTVDPADCREHHGQTICEDCYMIALSPAKACDPWAVYSAKSFSGEDAGGHRVTDIQAKILKLLEQTGGVEREAIAERLQLDPGELDRQIATLRHMEKLRAKLQGGRKVICLWSS